MKNDTRHITDWRLKIEKTGFDIDILHKHLGVQFVYKEEQKAEDVALSGVEGKRKAEKRAADTGGVGDAACGVAEALEAGAHRADFLLFSSVIEQIRGQGARLAAALAQLAEDFEYDEILALIQHTKIYG